MTGRHGFAFFQDSLDGVDGGQQGAAFPAVVKCGENRLHQFQAPPLPGCSLIPAIGQPRMDGTAQGLDVRLVDAAAIV